MVIGSCKSSGELSSSQQAMSTAGPGWLIGFTIHTDLSSDANVVLWDNATAASGTQIGKCLFAASVGVKDIMYPLPVRVENGIWIDISGTNNSIIVLYAQQEA